jgi:two-component system OmpR family response regulator
MQKLITYLVEDNPLIRTSLIETLGEIPHLEIAGHSETQNEACQWLARRSDWHLAIVDLFLKQGTGLGVLAACRDRAPFQKAVVLTNYATPEIRERSQALGADAVFDKSTELEDLLRYCAQLIRRLAQKPPRSPQQNAPRRGYLLN